MNVRLTSISLIALLAASGGSALAQSAGGSSFCDTGYMQADANSDGGVNEQELKKVTDAEFSELDANSDGTVTRAEYSDCRGSWTQQASNAEPMTEEDVSALDSNQDGVIDQDEYMSKADQEYTARWGETGTGKQVRDADFAPATQNNAGGVGADETNTAGGTQGSTASGSQPRSAQSGGQQSGTSAEGGAGTQTAAAGSGTGQGASGAQGDAQGDDGTLILRRIILIPQGDERAPGDMSREEIAHLTALKFLLLDANRNRQIDPEEQKGSGADQASLDETVNQQFDRADTDKSGDLSREEYAADTQKRWQQAQDRQKTMSGQSSQQNAAQQSSSEQSSNQQSSDQQSSDQQSSDQQSSNQNVGAPVVYYRYPHTF